MKLLVDMNLSPRWALTLQSAGFEALHWSEVGRAGAADTEIMAYALRSGFVVLTHDLDFGAILSATRGLGPSVVQIRSEDVSPEEIAERVVQALSQMREELEQGALLSIDPKRTRVGLLPLDRRA